MRFSVGDRARVGGRHGGEDDGDCFGDPVGRESVVRECLGGVQAFAELLEPGQGLGGAEGCGDAGLGVGCVGRVEGQDVGEHGGVGLGMREVERAAQDVADLVVQPGTGRGERDGGQVRAVKGLLASLDSGRVGGDERQALAEGTDSFGAEGCVDRVHAGAPHRVDAVGHAVQAGGHGHIHRKGQCQCRVVDDRDGQDGRVHSSGLPGCFGQAPHVGGF